MVVPLVGTWGPRDPWVLPRTGVLVHSRRRLLQRWLTDPLNPFLPPEDKEGLRPWWQLVVVGVVAVGIAVIVKMASYP